MNTSQSSLCLNQFSWEEWDNQMIVVLYRCDRRFVVQRYIERVLANSSQWQRLAKSSFPSIEPIGRTYKMMEHEVKLMHKIFSWHLNGTLSFSIIGELDQLLDWEDLLDFIERAQIASKNNKRNQSKTINSPSIVPTIPVGTSVLTKKIVEKNPIADNLQAKKNDLAPIKMNKKVLQPQRSFDENTLSSSSNNWIQINNICIPYINKSQQSRLLPYQVLVDCDLLNEKEQSFLFHFTTKASSVDIENFERIISTSSSIDFTLDSDLMLIDLYHLIFGMSKVLYVKLLNNQRDVNKSYKTVLAQRGGTALVHSRSVPFITVGKRDCMLLESLSTILQPTTKNMSSLRRHSLLARSHEIDYLRLVEFYQRTYQQDDSKNLNQQQQLLVNIDKIQKYVDENDIIIDMSLAQYQQIEFQKLKNQIEINQNEIQRNAKQTQL
ncbi:unnamed protein product [Rotaria magnacalcarata]|uniref:Uncharacterized protein n=1 Tax=Rotaria magnacalcarata TaxID=392030 RepID=A0A816Y9T2_9BILA|nr:unnamed protein product [Rotaria magnacalcarata]CAF1394839.1 unnamed protein product [Rotaria magnacalcarata]CAF2157932.1 unnamed protein product [Rotaria magnacalcarata]CAF3812779.1 unnamed protein product [Rotaria magnacalcarata]CAF3819377.1 unnamed protein product [Rotaria magnacalcarata]